MAIECDNAAMMAGYTRHVIVTSGDGCSDFAALIKPDTDFDERFKAFDTDNQEMIAVNGWNCIIEDAD
jgi:hypothetical protein